MQALTALGIAKDHESPENPGAMDRRVAMLPPQVAELVARGLDVSVETGAGGGIGHADESYRAAGARIVTREEVYADKDLVLKLKGVALEDIARMRRGTVLFCMAHFHSFPARAKQLEDAGIQVVAMEEVMDSPKKVSDEIVIGKGAMRLWLAEHPLPSTQLDISVVGYSEILVGALRRAGNRNPNTLTLLRPEVDVSSLPPPTERSVVVFDSASDPTHTSARGDTLTSLREAGARVYDVQDFNEDHPDEVEEYWGSHPRFELGGRSIQCLHETGMAGAGYGLKLLEQTSPLGLVPGRVRACVLGYGNVGMGAIHRCYEAGVPVVDVLTRATTGADRIGPFLAAGHLFVNGAEQPREMRGKNYLISRHHTDDLLTKGAVVIDLVGGSAVNRSAVEDVVECTFLTEPHFTRGGVYFSSLWGWPMMGMMEESARRYSGQVLEVLVGDGGLLGGVASMSPGLRRAVLSGPHAFAQ